MKWGRDFDMKYKNVFDPINGGTDEFKYIFFMYPAMKKKKKDSSYLQKMGGGREIKNMYIKALKN